MGRSLCWSQDFAVCFCCRRYSGEEKGKAVNPSSRMTNQCGNFTVNLGGVDITSKRGDLPAVTIRRRAMHARM